MQARFPEGTFERIAAALRATEDRTDFVRTAVEHELKRREASKGIQKKVTAYNKADKSSDRTSK